MRKKLFIPGPVEVSEDVLLKMSAPMIGHRSKDASELQRSITKKMQKLMFTNSAVLLSTSSGSGLMEGAVRSCTRKRAAIFSIGAFGDRWYKMAVSNGVPADIFASEPGSITTPKMVRNALESGRYDLITITHNETATGVENPVEEIADVLKSFPEVVWCMDAVSSLGGVRIPVDELGVDICIASTQKCLGLPPGMSLCSFSEKAVKAAEKVENRGLYFDLLEIYQYILKKDHQYPSTPSISHMYALDHQLDKILSNGIENRFNAHTAMAKITQNWAKERFELFCDEKYASKTVTCIKNTGEINVADLNKFLGENGYIISNGYGSLKDVTFRIAHMADTTEEEIKTLLDLIDEYLSIKL